ncbi:MAG: POT family MFS transporter [Planctomycetota bacterium]
MTQTAHRTQPDPTRTTTPPGIPYILGNEAAERFSFYGMKSILVVFMTKHLLDAAGEPANMTEERAKEIYHYFSAAAYFFPIIGSLIADVLFGKYKTILYLSLLYCVGHGCLAIMDLGPALGMDMVPWLYAGLLFIAMGAGAIKPCVSAHVGDQFGEGNKHLISKTFSWFYFSINTGALLSTIFTPIFLAKAGPWLAFGVPGVLMALATFVFWLGRTKFIHVPPSGSKFKEETLSRDGLRAVLNLTPIFLIFIPAFWALFDQTGSAWVLQANDMDRKILWWDLLPSQIQALNPFFILVLIPVFAYVLYPAIDKVWRVTPLRKMGMGLFLTAGAFAIAGWIQVRIDAGETPHVVWQFLAYFIMTAAEVMVSITSLEFAYTQAPKKMKSFIMGIYFLGVSLGNLFTGRVNGELAKMKEQGQEMLQGANYYWFFTYFMLAVAVVFVIYAMFYRGKTFVQGEDAGQEGGDPAVTGHEVHE